MGLLWYPHPGPQEDFCRSWQDEVLYGGAAGGGKSDCLIMEATRCINFPEYHGLIARRTFPQLQEIIDRTRRYYPHFGGDWRATEHAWYFPSGAKITLGHCNNAGDEYNYQGKEFQFIGLDEAGQFLPKQILYLFSRNRSTNPNIPKRMRYASNPGGPAHQFLKDRFRIGEYPKGGHTFSDEVTVELDETHTIHEIITRIFVPAKLADNPTLLRNDPGYVARLMQLPEIERMRLLKGIWDAFEGQAFIELNFATHSFKPFDIPPEWPRFRTFDWGYAAPFTVLWWASDYDGRLYIYRQWYGGKKDDMNQKTIGLRMSASEIARGIVDQELKEKQRGIRIMPGPADPSIWNRRRDTKTGQLGISVADEMLQEGVTWLRGNNDRILGRQQLHSRLRPDEKGDPRLFISEECVDWWRTIPQLREDKHNPEDIFQKDDTEDHDYDCTRYGLMFHPIRAERSAAPDIGSFQHARRKYIIAKRNAAKYGTTITDAYRSAR